MQDSLYRVTYSIKSETFVYNGQDIRVTLVKDMMHIKKLFEGQLYVKMLD